ncbi:beta-N-acetylhexosaminidase [Compostibacter hankyongensis]
MIQHPKRKIKTGLLLGLCLILSTGLTAQRRTDTPALIPAPQSVEWTGGNFALSRCRAVVVSDPSLEKEVSRWQQRMGLHIPVTQGGGDEPNSLRVILEKVNVPMGATEAYRLEADSKGITLAANTPHGIFNGLQTLAQLTAGNHNVPGCHIVDYPAYPWRGFMVDVGRNYQSPELLKQQIDIMSRYKLNVFHFHLTEDVAWRLQIRKYPRLTAAETMTRNKGKFYSIAEMKDLIRYCRERHITLVPELDMPGHSKAFFRAMGTDMQSDSGLHIVKEILREVCTTYDVPYIHIGGDEVAIRNKRFLPEVARLIAGYHKQVIGWAPGGNYPENTIRHVWGNRAEPDIRAGARYIDSRDLYLSDMDPESSVVTIFDRQLGGRVRGDSQLLGAEICLWDDRRMAREEDHLIQNAVYPDMLAFGERSWKGGGYPGTVLSIGPDTSARAKEFKAFEQRLLAHKKAYFSKLPFPYAGQTRLRWKLFGPFENNGNTGASFWPEYADSTPLDSAASVRATGATLWLWYHNNDHNYESWIPEPRQHTTWYAYTRLWSSSDTTIRMWIGFRNLLRSLARETPEAGTWDEKQSNIRINGKIIPPPAWKYPGRQLHKDLELPLTDENYYFRPPAFVSLKKGWNTILVKLPLLMPESFEPWQRRCMFTVIPVHREAGDINWYADPVRSDPDR